MIGVRRPDVTWGEGGWDARALEPGEYMKIIDGPMPWMANDPNGGGPFSIGLKNHTVEEHEDGTITVSPSLYDTSPGGWHGWLERGVWRSC